jgi:hypothetical protein
MGGFVKPKVTVGLSDTGPSDCPDPMRSERPGVRLGRIVWACQSQDRLQWANGCIHARCARRVCDVRHAVCFLNKETAHGLRLSESRTLFSRPDEQEKSGVLDNREHDALLRDERGWAEANVDCSTGAMLSGEGGAISQEASVRGGQECANRMPGRGATARSSEPPHRHLAPRRACCRLSASRGS